MTIAELFDLNATIAAALFAGKRDPWAVLPEIKQFIRALGATLPDSIFDHPAEDVWIARDAKIFPSAYLGAPLIVDEGAEIRHCAFVRGAAIVGKRAVVGNSTELKNCVLFDGAQVPHFNYVGDSILGHRAHLGAGAVTSNVKSDKTLVTVLRDGLRVETGLKKLGAMLGDFAEVGCNSVLNPGVIVGRNSRVYPASCVRGTIPENSIYKRADCVVPIREAGME